MKESKAPSLGRTPAQKFLDKWQGLIYLIPWIIGFIVFKAIPFGQSLYYSFTDMNFFNGIHQYGVMNYVTAFSDAVPFTTSRPFWAAPLPSPCCGRPFSVMMVWSTPSSAPSPSATHRAPPG